MIAIVNSPASTATALLLQGAAGLVFDDVGKSATGTATAGSSSGAPADIVELSDHAKATIEKAQADRAATADLTLSFDEVLAKRSDDLTKTLTNAFAGLNVNLDDAVRLQVDKFGNVTTEGPWKKKIEQLFQDRPELAKELKTISSLNSLKATQKALDLYTDEKKSATSKKQQAEAWTRYNVRSINIQALSGVMSLKDGKLRSAAADYIDMIADPAGTDPTKSQQDIADRLA
jgi:hypothetical protein